MSKDSEAPTQTRPGEATGPVPVSRGRKIAFIIGIVVLVIGAVISARWVVWRLGHAVTDAAYVEADIANVAPHVAGKIVAVEVHEGERVHAGQVLFRIDPSEYDRKVAAASAVLTAARAAAARARSGLALARKTVPADIAAARAGVAAARSQLAKAEANLARWEKQEQRFRRLLEARAVGRAQFEQVDTAWKAARADVEAARAAVKAAEARLAQARAARARIAGAEAALKQAEDGVRRAQAGLRLARLARSWCDVTAPIDGLVARVLQHPGDFAAPGRPAIGLYDPRTRYVEARFEETKLRYIGVGKAVTMTVDREPGKRFTGHVFLVAPASAAEFALIPRDVTAGEFTKVTQRVPVKIRIDHLEKYPELVPGLSVVVAVKK